MDNQLPRLGYPRSLSNFVLIQVKVWNRNRISSKLKTPSQSLRSLILIYVAATVVLFVAEYIHVVATGIVWWVVQSPDSVNESTALVSSLSFALVVGIPFAFAIWIVAAIRNQTASRKNETIRPR